MIRSRRTGGATAADPVNRLTIVARLADCGRTKRSRLPPPLTPRDVWATPADDDGLTIEMVRACLLKQRVLTHEEVPIFRLLVPGLPAVSTATPSRSVEKTGPPPH